MNTGTRPHRHPPTGPYVGFAQELRRVRMRDGLRQVDVAKAVGTGFEAVMMWENGTYLPDHRTVIKLGDLFANDELVRLSVKSRTSACLVCGGMTFAVKGTRDYCSEACQRLSQYRRRRGVTTSDDWRSAQRILPEYRAAVDAFCRRCEPDGICSRAACELRPVSPLPLVAA